MSRVKRNPCTTSFGANTTFWQHKARDYVTQLRNMYHSLSNACSAAPGCVLGAPEVREAAIYETTALIILHKKTKKPENGVAWSVKTNR